MATDPPQQEQPAQRTKTSDRSGRPQRLYSSPCRYPGGKGKISNYVKLVFLENDLVGHEYAELYAGGSSVALDLLYEEYASHIHINDLNRGVYALWDACLNNTDVLCQLVIDTPVTPEEWARQKAVQQDPDAEPLALGFSTFFLNRTNRSGIISGGMIGGKDQGGDWKLDARYNKEALVKRIEKVGRYRSRITLTGIDTAEYLRTVMPQLPRNTFKYLDPPYYVKGEDLYEHFYQHRDHEEIAALMRTTPGPWLVSYDAAPEVEVLYAGFQSLAYGLPYSAAERRTGSEFMFFSADITPPDVPSPANIYATDVARARREIFEATYGVARQ